VSDRLAINEVDFLPARSLCSRILASVFCWAFLAACGDSIHDVVNREDLACAQAMLAKAPALVNARTSNGKTPLHYAVTYGQPTFIDFFVSRGADVNAADKTGLTPLHAAAMLGREKEADELIRHGANVEARDAFGDTPLHLAALFGQSRMLKHLAEAGASINTVNNDNVTPRQAALKSRRIDAVDALDRLGKQDR